jgi:hypothetical protein
MAREVIMPKFGFTHLTCLRRGAHGGSTPIALRGVSHDLCTSKSMKREARALLSCVYSTKMSVGKRHYLC